MPSRQEIIAELQQRAQQGKFSGRQQQVYQELQRRGVFGDPEPQARVSKGFQRVLEEGGLPEQDRQRLIRTGVTPGTAPEFAAAHIQSIKARTGEQPSTGRQTAIFDLYKRMAGRQDVAGRDYFAEQQQRERAQRRETLGGRFIDTGAAYNQALAETGLSILGTVAPTTAENLAENVEQVYGTDPASRAATVGQAIAEVPKLYATAATGPAGLAGVYGAQGAGSVRREAAALREAGEDVSGLAEAGTAVAAGATEAASGFVGGRIFRSMGKVLRGASPQLRAAAARGDAGAVRKLVNIATRTTGHAAAEGVEEMATQAAVNAIRRGINPEAAITEGLVEAGVMGAALSPVGAGGIDTVSAARRRPADTAEEIDPADLIRGEAPVRDAEPEAADVTGEVEALRRMGERARTEQAAEAALAETEAVPTTVSKDRSRAQFTGPFARLQATEFAERLKEQRGPDVKAEVRPLRGGTGFEVRTEQGIIPDVEKPLAPSVQAMTQTQQRRAVRQAREAGFAVERKEDLTDEIVQNVREGRTAPSDARLGGRRETTPETAEPPTGQPERRQRQERRHASLAEQRQQISRLYAEGKTAEAEAAIEGLQEQARRDPKGTGLLSGTTFDQVAADVEANVNETGEPRHIMLADVANLGLTNTVLGHQGADAELQRVADAVLEVAGPEASFRTGGDEIGVVFPPGTTRTQARRMMKQVEEKVGHREIVPGASMFVSGSLGTVRPGQNIKDVIAQTDEKSEARKKRIKQERGERTSISKDEAADLAKQMARDAEGVISAAQQNIVPKEEAVDEMVREEAIETQAENEVEGVVSPYDPDGLLEMTVPQIERLPDQSQVRQAFSKGFTPLGTVIRRWAPRMYGRMKQHQAAYRRDRHDADVQAHKLEQLVKRHLDKDQQQRLLYNWQTGRWDEARQLLDEHADDAATDIKTQFDEVTRLKDQVREDGVNAGLKIGRIEMHFPRHVKPGKYQEWADILQGEEKSDLDLMIEEARRKKGRDLTDEEEAEVANKWLAGWRHQKPGETSPRILSRRSVEDLTFEQWQEFYQNDFSPLYTYFDRTIYNAHKARLFGKQSQDETMEETLGRMMVEGKYGIKNLSRYQKNRLRSAIGSAYTGGEQSPAKAWRHIRDAGYIGTLMDPSSAAIQFGDLALIAARDGHHPLLRAIPQSMREKVLTAKNLGMEHLSEEYGSHGRMATSVRKLFKAVGFHYIDSKALTINMVSAVRQARRLANAPQDSTRFRRWAEEWGPAFGEQFPALVRDLRAGTNSDLVQDYAYMQASETRPNDIMDMPEAYAKNPNARIVWQLKGFAMKQFDFIRNRGYRKIARGVRNNDARLAAEGTADLVRVMTVLTLAGASFDFLRDWLLGRNPDFQKSLIDGLLYTHLGSVYLIGVASEDGPGSAIMDFITPPLPDMMDTMWRDMTNGTYTSLKYMPFGKTIYSFTPEHEAKMSKYARRDALDAAAQAFRDGDVPAARTYVRAFNDEMKNIGREERLSMVSVRRSAAAREKK